MADEKRYPKLDVPLRDFIGDGSNSTTEMSFLLTSGRMSKNTEILSEVRWKNGVLMQKRRIWEGDRMWDEWQPVPELEE